MEIKSIRFSSIKIIAGIFSFLILLLFLVQPCYAQTATLTYEASNSNPSQNEIFNIRFYVNTPSAEINTVRLILSYPQDRLKVISANLTGSVVSSLIEKNISQPGQVDITSFTSGSFKGNQGLVATLEFQALVNGGGEIEILSSSKVHLADGKGTNIYRSNSLSAGENLLTPTPTITTSLFSNLRNKAVSLINSLTGEEQTEESLLPQPPTNQALPSPKLTSQQNLKLILFLFLIFAAIVLIIYIIIILVKKRRSEPEP